MSTESNIQLANGAISLAGQVLKTVRENQASKIQVDKSLANKTKIEGYVNTAILIAGLIPQARLIIEELVAIYKLFTDNGIEVPSIEECIKLNEELKQLPNLTEV